ncbi:MAG: cob(I)yrinic acid a,c-diamide adenosyltransferase [Candidatus Competibacteraceae bacterium]|nr:cob(I)yrinic acid a,c-diamide adenosyltransferase [Candidatus Competibacteraceae bacterium]
MKIYTKTGDKGTTALMGGVRVSKHHPRIEAYGTIDELNSWLGLIKDQPIPESSKQDLLIIQYRLFEAGSLLAAEPGNTKIWVPEIKLDAISQLENSIDLMEQSLPPLQNFILPGGHPASSYTHIARCVCRRAERLVVQVADSEQVPSEILVFLNRLSDYLFVLARFISAHFGADEIPWKPRSQKI